LWTVRRQEIPGGDWVNACGKALTGLTESSYPVSRDIQQLDHQEAVPGAKGILLELVILQPQSPMLNINDSDFLRARARCRVIYIDIIHNNSTRWVM
jgi:hypothetical protein